MINFSRYIYLYYLSLINVPYSSPFYPGLSSRSSNRSKRGHVIESYNNDIEKVELAWKIYRSIEYCDVTEEITCGEICPSCDGEGEAICRYCKGTGFMMLADELVGTLNDCPVCTGTGYEECHDCMGAGMIAHWHKDYKNHK